MSRSDVVRQYIDAVWNQGDASALTLAEPCYLHQVDQRDSGPLIELSVEDQHDRIARAQSGAERSEFEIQQLIESDELVTVVWNLTRYPADDTEAQGLREQGYFLDEAQNMLTKGIDVFRVVDDAIVEIWETQGPWLPGHWGESKTGDLSTTDANAMAPDEVVRDYVTRIWNKADPTSIEDYIADECWRHDAGEPDRQFMVFDHEFQHVRAQEGYANGLFDFRFIELPVAGDYVTFIWDLNMFLTREGLRQEMEAKGAQFDQDGNMMAKGIEVFHIVDGKIVENWIAQGWEYKGHWGPTMSRQ